MWFFGWFYKSSFFERGHRHEYFVKYPISFGKKCYKLIIKRVKVSSLGSYTFPSDILIKNENFEISTKKVPFFCKEILKEFGKGKNDQIVECREASDWAMFASFGDFTIKKRNLKSWNIILSLNVPY